MRLITREYGTLQKTKYLRAGKFLSFLTDTAKTLSEYLSIDPKNIHNNRRVSENQTCKISSIVNLSFVLSFFLSFFLSSEFPSLTQDCLDLSSNFVYISTPFYSKIESWLIHRNHN